MGTNTHAIAKIYDIKSIILKHNVNSNMKILNFFGAETCPIR